jgi:acyl-homoserine lactone acylase PvdQ
VPCRVQHNFDQKAGELMKNKVLWYVPAILLVLALATPTHSLEARDRQSAAGIATSKGQSETLEVPGLQQPVEILKDRWGISHIYAKNEHDLFFAQGYNVASGRLFQLEMWRRQATGTVAQIVGPKGLDRDIGNRLFMYRGDLTQELEWYHPDGPKIVQEFVDGINAYIMRTREHPELLTPEFKMLCSVTSMKHLILPWLFARSVSTR